MEFVPVPFPDCIAFGAQSDPMWSTNIVTTHGGQDAANQNWSDCKHTFDVSFAVRTVTNYIMVRTHFHQVRGRAKKFPFKDFLDYIVLQSEGVLLDAVGGLQMHRRYGSDPYAYYRKITRPALGTVAVLRMRSAVLSDVTLTSSIDHDTGLVVVDSPESDDYYYWSGEFVVPCRYDIDRLPALVVNKEPGTEGELLVQCESIQIVEVKE